MSDSLTSLELEEIVSTEIVAYLKKIKSNEVQVNWNAQRYRDRNK